MQTSTKIKVLAAFAVIAGPFFTYVGYMDKARLATLEKDGVTVDGVIEGGGWSKARRSSEYKFDVSFTPQNGPPTQQTFRVTYDFFSAHASNTTVTDPAVKVRYHPAKIQDSAIIVGGSTDATGCFTGGIAAFAIGLTILGGIHFYQR